MLNASARNSSRVCSRITKVLEQRHVPVRAAGSEKRVAARVAVGIRRRDGKRARIEPVLQGLRIGHRPDHVGPAAGACSSWRSAAPARTAGRSVPSECRWSAIRREPISEAAAVQQVLSPSERQFPQVTQRQAVPHIDDRIPRSAREVARILRLRSRRTAAKFQRHVVNGVRPGIAENCAQTFLNRLSTVNWHRVILAESVGGEVADVAQVRIDGIQRAASVQRGRRREPPGWRCRCCTDGVPDCRLRPS